MAHPEISQGAIEVVTRLRGACHQAWLVGGCVRDYLLDSQPKDYDVATSARPEEVRALFEHTVPVGEAFGVVLVLIGQEQFEVATFRAEAEYRDGRRPDRVEYADVEADVLRRDFTINGLLLDPLTGEVTDLTGGRSDLDAHVIRCIGSAEERFAEDHLRMLRAIRFASTLEFDIEERTLAAIAAHAPSITRISAERIREELTRLLTGGNANDGLELLRSTGLLAHLLPEVEAMYGCEQPPRFHPEGDVWEHTMLMLHMLPKGCDARLAWGVLLHDVGKPPTRQQDEQGVHFYGHDERGVLLARDILSRLRFSTSDMELVLALIGDHMRFMHVRQMRPNKLKRFLRSDRFDLHLELHRLDCASCHGMLDNHTFCAEALENLDEEELRPPRLLSGNDLIAMGFVPGPLFSEILTAIEDAQLDGELDDPDAARAFVLARWTPDAARS